MTETGLSAALGWVLLGVGFVVLSKYLFFKTAYAPLLYGITAVGVATQLGARGRNDQLRLIFSDGHYRWIRVLENSLVGLPFVLYLLYEQQYKYALGLLPVLMLLALWRFRWGSRRVLPTPFGRIPFEFPTGYRKAILVPIIAYFLVGKGIQVGNFYLSLFGLALLLLTALYYYSTLEHPFFVWVFRGGGGVFLRGKIRDACVGAGLLTVVAVVLIIGFFPENFWWVLGVELIGCLLLIVSILAKYSDFPREMGVPQAFLLAIGCLFPPLLLPIALFFYRRAVARLNLLLEC